MLSLYNNIVSSAFVLSFSVITDELKLWLGFKTSEVVGREEVVNGDFATDLSGWIISNDDATHSVTWVGGAARYVSDTTSPQLNLDQTINAVIGAEYQVSINVTYTTGSLKIASIDGNQTILNEGLNVFNIVAASNTLRILRGGTNVDALINSASIKEVSQFVKDKSPNTNNAKLFTGKALDFDGSNDYISIGAFPSYDAVTIAISIKTNSSTFGGSSGIIGRGSATAAHSNWAVWGTSSGLAIYVGDGTNSDVFSIATAQFTADSWDRLVIRIDYTAKTIKAELNNVNKVNDSFSLTKDSGSDVIILGALTTSSFREDCALADFQIYNSILSDADVTYDYENPNHLVTDNPNTSLTVTNLKGYWALSEGAGSVAYDSSGEGNNGTIDGATYVPAQDTIPQLGMMNWAKGSNLEPTSDSGTYGSSPASEILTQSPLQSNTAIIPVPSALANRYQYDFAGGVYSSGQVLTYSWYSKQITTPLLTFVGNLNPKTSSWVNCTLVTAAQEIESDINGWDRFSISFSIDDGSLASIMRPYFGDVIGVGNQSVAYWGHQLEESTSAGNFILTDGAAAIDVTTIQNPSNKGYDILGNALRLRENAFNLDGSGYAEVVKGSDFNFGTGDFTLEAWVKYKFSNTGSGVNAILGLGQQLGGATTAGLETTNNNRFAFVCGSLVTDSTAGLVLTEGDWYHVVGVRESSTVTLYVDAVNKKNGTSTANVTNTDNIKVGQDTSTARYYKELISDCRIYDRALTSDEILNNYNAGLSAHTN